MKSFAGCFVFLFLFPALYANSIDLKAGMIIKSSATINRNEYQLNAAPGFTTPVITIEGSNITVDFNQSILRGSNDKNTPDEFYGLSLLIKKGSKNITIKNALIHGYQVAILADSVTNLTIENCDLGYNWRQHLQSTREKEDLTDWMSFHVNEKDEWLRYGAGIYLKNCKKAVIINNIITGGQCALLMTGCDLAEVYDNNFSFNSGLGIGLYRSSNNKIYHNRLDYNVRGYSFGKYKRGQDSAGILVYEQSNDNIFAYNSATHSGDGFFLWAGQTTMNTGKGGCNDNFIYGNDFSYAPTNGIEITFSRNLVMKNIVKECDNGIWAGYSYDSDITDNTFENNRTAIAIEHGQNINIALNTFTGDTTAIKLWSRQKQPEDWVYPKLRNTESKNYWIASNHFTGTAVAFDIMGTDTVDLSGNTRTGVDVAFILGEGAENIDTTRDQDQLDMDYQKDPRLQNLKATRLPVANIPMGKEEIRMTEWGPYDFRYPLVWLKKIDSDGLYHFEILGGQGNWAIKQLHGFEISAKGDNGFPSYLVARPDKNQSLRSIQLTYTGAPFINTFGRKQDSGTVYSFSYKE